jgi:two-component system cell cycle response regulator
MKALHRNDAPGRRAKPFVFRSTVIATIVLSTLTKPFDVDELKARLRTGHDLLTSIWNRGVIVELISHEITRSRREKSCTAVMMCDIDHFKSVNDQYGHSVGDDVLREVARRLHHSVRSYDMVERYGGEEFLVSLNKCNPESAVARAENLRAKIGGCPIQTANKQVTVTISIGLALSTEFTQCTVEETIHQADMALYAAKAAGRNCVRVAHPSDVSKPVEEQPKETPVLAP